MSAWPPRNSGAPGRSRRCPSRRARAPRCARPGGRRRPPRTWPWRPRSRHGRPGRQQPGRLPHREPDRLDVDVGVGQPLRHRLEEPIGRPNCHPALARTPRSAPAPARSPRAASRTARPCRAPPASRDPGAVAGTAEHPVVGQRRAVAARPARAAPTPSPAAAPRVTPASDGATRNTSTPSGEAHGTRSRSASGAASTAVFTPDSTHRPSRPFGPGRRHPRVVPVLLGQRRGQHQLALPAGAAHRRCCAAVPNAATAPAPSTIEARYGTLEHRTAQLDQHRALLQQAEAGPAQRLGQPGREHARRGQIAHSASNGRRARPGSSCVRPASSVCSSVKREVHAKLSSREVHATAEQRAARARRPR